MRRIGILLGLLALPATASAIDLDYYTYNGFEETVAAFERLALILNDSAFWVLAGVVVVTGIIFGALGTAIKGMSGGQANPVGWAIPIVVGAALARGLLVPTGTLHVYDPVRNAYQAVDDVPDMIVLVAGVMSKIERGMTDIVDAASANPYSEQAGSLSYSLIQSALTTSVDNSDLVTSLERYYADCGTFAVRTGHNGASMSELRRTSNDLKDTFAKFSHPSLYTVVYTAGNSVGTVKSCKDAWDQDLNPALDAGANATFQGMRESLCQRSGFNAGSAAQMARCDEEIDNATALYGLPAASSTTFLRSVLLARTVMDALQTEDLGESQSALINRQMMAEGFGAATAMNEWAPKIRGFLVAITLGIIPVALLFVATPLVFKALFLIMGMFVWVTLWGVMDAVAAQMAQDAAVDAFSQVRRYNMGMDAILLSPEASVKALGIFGKARGMALMLATFVAMALFRFGGYALTQAAGDLQSHVNQIGESGGRDSLLPEQTAALMRSLSGAPGAPAMQANFGFDRSAFASSRGEMAGGYESQSFINTSLAGGGAPSAYMQRMGAIDAGQYQGGVRGFQAVADNNRTTIGDVAYETAETREIVSREADMMRRDIARDSIGGINNLGRIEGGMSAGDTVAKGEVYENTAGERSYSDTGGWQKVGRHSNAALIGTTREATPDENVDRFATEAKTSIARAQEVERRGAAELIGTTTGAQDSLRSEGFAESHAKLGDDAVRKGEEYNVSSLAARGAAAGELGDVTAEASDVARTDLASAVAGSEVARDAARFLGLDPTSMAGLSKSEETQRGARVSFSVNDENRDQIVSSLKDGGMDNYAIERHLMREGGTVTISMDRNGSAVSAEVVAGHKAEVFDLARKSVGVESRAVDISERVIDRSEKILGDVAYTNNATDAEAAFGYIFAAGQERVANDTLYDAFLKNVSEAEHVQGFTHRSSETNFDNTMNTITGGAGWSTEKMWGGAIAKATGIAANIGDTLQRSDGQSDENSIAMDPIVSSARFVADMTRVDAVNQARDEFGLVSLSDVEALRISDNDEDRARYNEYVDRVDALHGKFFTETWREVVGFARNTLDDVRYGSEVTDASIDTEVAKSAESSRTENPAAFGYKG